MQDLTLILLFLTEGAAGVLITLAFILRLRLKKCAREALIKNLARINQKDLPIFYSSSDILQASKRKFFHLSPIKENVLALAALKNPALALPLIRRFLKKEPKNTRLLLLYAEVSLLLNNRIASQTAFEQIALPRFASPGIKAAYLRLNALNSLYLTDMQNASVAASRALKICQKHNFSYEEAECYLTLAQIYRISGCFDVACTMLKEAQKIFLSLKIPAKIAETTAYFGLIELGRENYDIAQSFLNDALKLCRKHNLSRTLADIKNWQGLVFYLKNNLKSAAAAFSFAIKNAKSEQTLAFAAEMSARINLRKNALKEALDNADTALKIYQKNRHQPGIFENLYLKAEIFFALKDEAQSEKILTRLIKQKAPHTAIYYPANAYTLLGIIKLKKNNYPLAKTLFKQALDLENSRNRLKGAAIDCCNLAELACRQGLDEEADTYLKQAKNLAKTLDDRELDALLNQKTNPPAMP